MAVAMGTPTRDQTHAHTCMKTKQIKCIEFLQEGRQAKIRLWPPYPGPYKKTSPGTADGSFGNASRKGIKRRRPGPPNPRQRQNDCSLWRHGRLCQAAPLPLKVVGRPRLDLAFVPQGRLDPRRRCSFHPPKSGGQNSTCSVLPRPAMSACPRCASRPGPRRPCRRRRQQHSGSDGRDPGTLSSQSHCEKSSQCVSDRCGSCLSRRRSTGGG